MTRGPEILPHTMEALLRDLRVQLAIEQGPDETREQWIERRARNIAMNFLGNYIGECRRCRSNGYGTGAVPVREIADFTVPLTIPTTERTEP